MSIALSPENIPPRTDVATAQPVATVRDPRLDFFRGIAMFIILCAHTPGNFFTSWIPARWGFSDATEMFVFCSGMASAIAFGGVFVRAGWVLGTARTAFRVWQVYWAHIGLFFAVVAFYSVLDTSGLFEKNYIDSLNLSFLRNDPLPQIAGLFTLSYVPNYFDILPMYLVILAMMPVMVALARVHVGLMVAASVLIWLLTQFDILDLPSEPWSERDWFFNPFGWQLVFFTGFALMAGWLPKPPVHKALIWASIGFVVLTSPLSSPRVVDILREVWPAAAQWSMDVYPSLADYRTKTEFGILRYLHFLSLAYLAWVAVGEGGRRLISNNVLWAGIVTVISKVGQQSLAVFLFSMFWARVMGFLWDQTERTVATVWAGNLFGFALLIVVAYSVAWFKSSPWRTKRKLA